MTDFKPNVPSSCLPPGFRQVRLNLDNQLNKSNRINTGENIYDEPCSFDINEQKNQIPPPLPFSQPPAISSYNQQNMSIAQPFRSLPFQEQEELQRHLQQHVSRSPTPILRQNLINAENIQKVITDKEPPANAEFFYETDAYKFYTLPTNSAQKIMNINQQTNINDGVIQGARPKVGIPLTSKKTGANHRHGSEWYRTMFKNMHITDKPKWMYEEPIKVKKNKKPKKETKLEKQAQMETHIYDNHTLIPNQNEFYLENEKKKKKLQKEIQKENPYFCDDSETKYIIKKKKTSKCKSPVSRKTYAMVQKGEDIPFNGLNKPDPKFKNKVGFYEEKPQAISRSPTPVCLTYPASDYVPERPPTPQYISQQQYNQTTTTINSYNKHTDDVITQSLDTENYDNSKRTRKEYRFNTENDFTTIDEWQRKMNNDFNQLYLSLERNFELKRLKDTGKFIPSESLSENRRDTSYRTAKELYLEQTSPKPPLRKYNFETSSLPLSASDLFNEDLYKKNKFNTISNTSESVRKWLNSTDKLNRYNSSQDLNYLNPNNNNYNFDNNLINSNYKTGTYTYQHNSLDNLNSLNTYTSKTSNYRPVHDWKYKIFAQPDTTRTYTESTYYDTTNHSIAEKTKLNASKKFQNHTSISDIEQQLNEQLGDLIRSTSNIDHIKDKPEFKLSCSPSFDSNLGNQATIIKNIKSDSSYMQHKNLESKKSINTFDNFISLNQPNIKNYANSEKLNKQIMNESTNKSNVCSNKQIYKKYAIDDETGKTEFKRIPFNLNSNQDVNNISFQTNEEDIDSYDKLIKKIEQDAILQDEEIGIY